MDDKNNAATPTPEFSGNILLFLNDGTISATKCWFESTNTTINFKMKSFSVEFYDRSNGGSPQLYHIIGYDNGIEKVRVNNFDTKTAGLQGMGTSAVNFTKNAFSSDGSTSGKLEFGTGWQDVDKVEFEVAETNNNYKYLFVALDNIVFETAVPAVLPVSLIDFSVKTRNDHILVNFKTAKEENNDFFIVSSSTDGVNFKILQNIIANHEKTINSYNFVDLKPSQGTNYYKLQQKDKNGLVNDLGLKSIDFKLDETQSFSFYPNPVKERLNLTFEAGKFNAVKLVTTTGKL
ncbi:MAG TPA: hypothetical protein VFM79_09515, partial [Pelobium sp.]|nr:hypothetical protein [Pelobium sp.]